MADHARVVDRQPTYHARISFEILDDHAVKAEDLLVYLALSRFANFNDGSCWPGTKRLAVLARKKPIIVRRAVRHLVLLGYLKVQTSRGRRTNLYTLLAPLRNRSPLAPVVGQPVPVGTSNRYPSAPVNRCPSAPRTRDKEQAPRTTPLRVCATCGKPVQTTTDRGRVSGHCGC